MMAIDYEAVLADLFRRRAELDAVIETVGRILSAVQVKAETSVLKAGNKNRGAVALGKLGGSKGGHARAAKLSIRRRKAIAKLAANARWARHAATPPTRP